MAIILKYFSSRNEGQCEPIRSQLLNILCGCYSNNHNIDILYHPLKESFFFSKQPDLDFCSFLSGLDLLEVYSKFLALSN